MGFDEQEKHDDTTEAHELRIKRCRSSKCNARIVYLKTAAGKSIPVDADTVAPDDEMYDSSKHTSHFATCVDAKDFRKPRQ
jgi:chorismate-pyruvate lyase